MTKEQLIHDYALFHCAATGIRAFAGPQMHDEVYERLSVLEENPLTKVQLNQLFVLSQAGSMSDGFFRYYWCMRPAHPYDVTALPFFYSARPFEKPAQEVSPVLHRKVEGQVFTLAVKRHSTCFSDHQR